MTATRAGRAGGASGLILTAAIALGACGGPAARPAGNPASIEVTYESAPKAPGRAEAKAALLPTYWRDRKDLIQSPPPPQAAELTLPKVDRWKMRNGLEVVVVARPDLPVVSFSMAIKAGGYDEEKASTLGVSSFTVSMLRKGTRTRSADAIARAIDFVGGTLDTQSGSESSGASCAALSRDSALCLDLLSDILLRPTFPEAEFPEVRDQMMAALNSRYDNPSELASEHFDNLLFGEKHPDGWVLTPDDVQKITQQQLVVFWKTFFRPNNAILAVAGDVDPVRLRVELEKAFGGWERAEVPERPVFKVPDVKMTRVLLVDRPDLTQSTLIFGHRGIKHIDPAWYAVTLMNYVLGGSDFSSRLMTEVRAKRALTYGIGSSFGASLYEGAFRVQASTKNASVWDALTASVAEIRRMKSDGPTPLELSKAKGFYAGSYPFNLQTADGVAANIVAADLHGLGLPYVRQFPLRMAGVTLKDARDAAATFLNPDNLWVVIVGRGAEVEPQIAKAGLPYERIDFKSPVSYAARAKARKAAKPAP
ncbi:MAG TPA: pitrilysin family protein [Polyangia bacterium]|nr:pitrilysin family protein [Polyangia bacterium]